MHLTSRIALDEQRGSDPEDIFSSSLATLFSDDIANQHGDGEHGIIYTSPNLPQGLRLELAKPVSLQDRHLFSHYLWNSSLLLAELIERDSFPVLQRNSEPKLREKVENSLGASVDFNIRGLNVMELGAGTALPSIMAGLLGARQVLVTDYPAPDFIKTLRINLAKNVQAEMAPKIASFAHPSITVEGHAWGEFNDAVSCSSNRHAFDRLFVCDCLWMPSQHKNLQQSISYFLGKGESSRAWIVAGFHTGRAKMRSFFEASSLASAGLQVSTIWEQDSDGTKRAWSWDLEEDPTFRKRWLVVASLERTEESIKS